MKTYRVVGVTLLLSFLSATALLGQSTTAERKVFEETRVKAQKGDAEAQLKLADMYASGEGVGIDLAKAAKWHRKAAEQGLARAQLLVGLDYAHGAGVKADAVEEVKWIRKAAEQGLAEAQLDLGLCYANGEGTKENDMEAARWFRKAADQNVLMAQFELGKCYFDGKGVTKDIPDAVEWTRKAAEQGLAAAQDAYARCYATGQGLTKDVVQAYKWYNLAAAQGGDLADDSKMSMAKIGTLMTPEQIAEGQRLAHEFSPVVLTEKPGARQTNAAPGSATDPKTGFLSVDAGDDACEIFSDSTFVGNSPARLRLAEGKHVIEVKKPGFRPYHREVQVTEGSELRLRPALEKE